MSLELCHSLMGESMVKKRDVAFPSQREMIDLGGQCNIFSLGILVFLR